MDALLGAIAIVGGVGLFFLAPRFVRANEASSAELFGRADPYRHAPRFTRAWSRGITYLVAAGFVAFGVLAIVGVVDLGGGA